MDAYPIKLSYHVRDYYFGERLIPDLLGKQDADSIEHWELTAWLDAGPRRDYLSPGRRGMRGAAIPLGRWRLDWNCSSYSS
jgi:hypothetical protein